MTLRLRLRQDVHSRPEDVGLVELQRVGRQQRLRVHGAVQAERSVEGGPTRTVPAIAIAVTVAVSPSSSSSSSSSSKKEPQLHRWVRFAQHAQVLLSGPQPLLLLQPVGIHLLTQTDRQTASSCGYPTLPYTTILDTCLETFAAALALAALSVSVSATAREVRAR